MDTKQQTAVMERRFWKRLCALNRFSFFVLAGGVARAADKAGNWIEAHSAQEIVDDAECEVSALKQRITDLEARLEVDARHPYDGIACRDATIAELQAGYDAARLDWLEQHDGRYYNLDKVASIVGTGFLVQSEGNMPQVHSTLREAVVAARKQGEKQ